LSDQGGTHRARALDKTPARTIGALTRTVAARARQAHSARAVCGATAAACIVLGCIVQRGGSVDDPGALILAAIVGGLAYFAWRLSRSVAAGDIACRVDDELGLRGAFVAAYETERERPNSAVAQLGAARLVACVRRRDAMEAAIPHTVGFVALPFLALAGLLFVIEASDRDARAESAGTLAALKLSATIGQIADRQGAALDGGQMDQLEQAAQAAAGAAGQGAEQQRRDLGDVAERLDELAREAPPGSELAEALSRAAARAEAAALDAEGDDSDGGDGGDDDGDDDAGQASPAGDGPETSEAPGPGKTAEDGTASESATAGGGAEGSEGDGSDTPTTPDPVPAAGNTEVDPAPTGPVGSTRTVGEIRWWSDRDASIVTRWMESVRSRADAPSDG